MTRIYFEANNFIKNIIEIQHYKIIIKLLFENIFRIENRFLLLILKNSKNQFISFTNICRHLLNLKKSIVVYKNNSRQT